MIHCLTLSFRNERQAYFFVTIFFFQPSIDNLILPLFCILYCMQDNTFIFMPKYFSLDINCATVVIMSKPFTPCFCCFVRQRAVWFYCTLKQRWPGDGEKEKKNGRRWLVKEKIMSSGHKKKAPKKNRNWMYTKKWEVTFIGATHSTHNLRPFQLHNAFNDSISAHLSLLWRNLQREKEIQSRRHYTSRTVEWIKEWKHCG